MRKKQTELYVDGLSFGYDKNHLLFQDIRFNVRSGEIICILGANGIGKTSLLSCIYNLYPSNSGTVYIDNQDIKQLSLKEIAQRISFVPQIILPTFDYSVLDYVVTGIAPHIGVFSRPKPSDYIRANGVLEQLQISYLAEKSYSRISGGERQQICIARALLQDAPIIILDEPTAHLDYGNQIKVLKILKHLKEQGYAVLFTTHNPDHALLVSDQTLAIKNLTCFFGPTSEIVTERFLRDLYQEEIHLCHVKEVNRNVCISAQI